MRIIAYATFRSFTHDIHSLASTPNEEECTQAGQDTDAQKIECKALINQLIRLHGEPPARCEFCIVRNEHDFGTYYEAGILYPQDNTDPYGWEEEDGIITPEEAAEAQAANEVIWDYINSCETLPDHWDDDAKAELYEAKHPRFHAKIIQLKTA